MREQIIELLDKEGKPLTEIEVSDLLKNNSTLQEICETLRDMERSGDIYRTNKGGYTLYKYTHLKTGRLDVNKKGFGFVLIDNGPDIHIKESNMNGAIQSDLVVVDMISKDEGKIIKIIDRSLNYVVGELKSDNDGYYIFSDNKKMNIKILIDKNNINGAVNGHKVLVRVYDQIRPNEFSGRIEKIIGYKDDPGVDILSIAAEHNIFDEFPQAVLDELKTIPLELSEEDIKGRTDLRDKEIFTIDGTDAKDFDDAVSLEILPNGNYVLGVHIADVSHYVYEGTALYGEALNRGTSNYLVNKVIPMLPQYLSNGICSLNPNVDRLTMSCIMEIDRNGNVIKSDFFKSVITSKKRMTYSNANRSIVDNEVIEDYDKFKPTLLKMSELSSILRNRKQERGYIDFDIDEMKIIVDEEGIPTDIKLRERGLFERVIEDFMIAANEAVAEYFTNLDFPCIYRVHDKPDEKKVKLFLDLLSNIGIRVKGNQNKISNGFFQKIVNVIRERNNKSLLKLALRSMKKAEYSVQNIGHFGLGSKDYLHFTSPIRRFPDLEVHTLLKMVLDGKNMNNESIGELIKKLIYIAEHSSAKERDAIECERDVEDMKAAEYMSYNIGKQYDGEVSGVIPSGMFIALENTVEGFVSMSSMSDDYYIVNEELQMLIGKKKGNSYRIGDKVKVEVVRASKEDRTIDFKIIK